MIAMPSRPHRFVVVLAAALASQTGCGDREKSAAATSAPPPPTTAGRDAAPVAPPPLAPIDATLKQHMQEHFASITEVQRAVVRSDLPAAQAAARYLAEHVEHEALDGWGPHVAAVRQAAEHVVHAADVPAAGLAAASLGRTCARCHHARSAIVAFAWEPEPEADASLVALRESSQGELNEHAYQIRLRDPSFRADLLDALHAIEDISEVSLLMQRSTVEI